MVEEEGRVLFHAGRRVEVHGGRPALPVLPAGRAVQGAEPFVEPELDGLFAGGLYEPGEGLEAFTGDGALAGGHGRGDIEAADEGPDAAVMVFAGPVKFLVAGPPIGIFGLDVGKKARRRVEGEGAMGAHGFAFAFHPADDGLGASRGGQAEQNGHGVAEEIEAGALVELVGPHGVIGFAGNDHEIRGQTTE